ncbi:hypothetical protein [Hydrogenophaga sp.]|uniref:hypothetical protein n=1 Tax=Hydrogenophaga sp. TaxID=1904254 RepID=UPI00271FBD8E|nr:hypothetical protein [Hydrogenophaga sp.]MDO9437927.1 hypothetical protein [Hydrogenophaga sp.]
MVIESATPVRDDVRLGQFIQGLATRTLAQVAEEARLDGESLKDIVDRYEIDFAWHVLGCERTRDAVLTLLESRLGGPVDDAQRAWVQSMLEAAALGQPSDSLMSFDNDVADQLLHLWTTGMAASAV